MLSTGQNGENFNSSSLTPSFRLILSSSRPVYVLLFLVGFCYLLARHARAISVSSDLISSKSGGSVSQHAAGISSGMCVRLLKEDEGRENSVATRLSWTYTDTVQQVHTLINIIINITVCVSLITSSVCTHEEKGRHY